MLRRHVLISLLFAVTVIAVFDACHAQGGSLGSLLGMITRLSMTGLVIVLFLGGSLLLQRWMAHQENARLCRVRPARPPGPGKFKVIGNDRDTRLETIEFIFADSPEHAATKVGLKGVDVRTVDEV